MPSTEQDPREWSSLSVQAACSSAEWLLQFALPLCLHFTHAFVKMPTLTRFIAYTVLAWVAIYEFNQHMPELGERFRQRQERQARLRDELERRRQQLAQGVQSEGT